MADTSLSWDYFILGAAADSIDYDVLFSATERQSYGSAKADFDFAATSLVSPLFGADSDTADIAVEGISGADILAAAGLSALVGPVGARFRDSSDRLETEGSSSGLSGVPRDPHHQQVNGSAFFYADVNGDGFGDVMIPVGDLFWPS